MKNILLEDRNCECCGNKSNKLELIWSGSRIVKGISDTYLFEHSILTCSIESYSIDIVSKYSD